MSLRLGGTWNAIADTLSLSAGGFWEPQAAPREYTHLDYPAGERFGGSIGTTYSVQTEGGTQMDFSLTYNYTHQKSTTVSESEGRVLQQRPLTPCPENCSEEPGVVANAGRFETAFQQLGLAIGLAF